MRVLIIEDNVDLGEQLKNSFQTAGYAVDLSIDGEDGMFLGANEHYDAVV